MGARRVCNKPGQVVEYSRVDKGLDEGVYRERGEQGDTRPLPTHNLPIPNRRGLAPLNCPPPCYTGPIKPLRRDMDRPYRHKGGR